MATPADIPNQEKLNGMTETDMVCSVANCQCYEKIRYEGRFAPVELQVGLDRIISRGFKVDEIMEALAWTGSNLFDAL